jgi:hypothetical protein
MEDRGGDRGDDRGGPGVRLVPVTLMAGIGTAVGSVAVYQLTIPFVVAVLASLALVLVTPRGWVSRLPFGVGYALTVGALSAARGEGDYLVTSSARGYAVLGLALVVLMLAVTTLPRPGARESGESPRSQ